MALNDIKVHRENAGASFDEVVANATAAEINTGTEAGKFATPAAISGSNIMATGKTGQISGLTDKATPVDADVTIIEDSAASNAKKKLTWANLKATLKSYFDTLYMTFAGGTLTGNITLGENTSIDLDSALSADGKYCGICRTGTAGAALAFGDLCYLDPTDSRWEKTNPNAAAGNDGDTRGLLGMCVLAAAANGSATKMLLIGTIRADAKFTTMTIGAPYYASETAGLIVVAQPTTASAVIRILGQAITADEIYFNPSPDWMAHT